MGRGTRNIGRKVLGRRVTRGIGRVSKPFYQTMDSVLGTNMSGKFGSPEAPLTDKVPEPELTLEVTPDDSISQTKDDTDTGLGDIASIFASEDDDWDKALGRYGKNKKK